MIPGLVLDPLATIARDRIASWLSERGDPALDGIIVADTDATVGDRVIVVLEGTPGPLRTLLAENSLRVRVRVREEQFDADDLDQLAALVRSFFETGLADGRPVTRARVTGPTDAAARTGWLERLLTVDVVQRARQLPRS